MIHEMAQANYQSELKPKLLQGEEKRVFLFFAKFVNFRSIQIAMTFQKERNCINKTGE